MTQFNPLIDYYQSFIYFILENQAEDIGISKNHRPSPLHPAGEMKLFDSSIGLTLQ